jgi:hypothetical protein
LEANVGHSWSNVVRVTFACDDVFETDRGAGGKKSWT